MIISFCYQLDNDIQNFLKSNNIPAVYKVVDINGNILALGKYETQNNKFTQDRILALSVTKYMTSYLILDSIQKDQLSYNNKIIDILDENHYIWSNHVPDWAYNVTIKDLLMHQSGVYDYLLDALFLGVDLGNIQQAKIDTMKISTSKPQKIKKFYYANINYFILGLILEEVYHDSIDNIFQEQIFLPAKMKNSRFATISEVLSPNDGSIVSVRSVAKTKSSNLNTSGIITLYLLNKYYSDESKDVFFSHDLSILPFADGGVISTIDDMINMMQFFYSKNLYQKDNQIGMEMFQKLNHVLGDKFIGMGSHTVKDHLIGHSGDAVGNRMEVFFSKKHNVYIAIYSNLESMQLSLLSSREKNFLDIYDLLIYIDELLSK